MALTDINSEDRLVQQTFAENLEKVLDWESVYAWNEETFGPVGMLGRTHECEVVLMSGVFMQTIFAKWLASPFIRNTMHS